MNDLRCFFESLLYKSLGTDRFTQDSPIYPNVWLDFALNPGEPQELLLTPTIESTAEAVAEQLRERLKDGNKDCVAVRKARIAANMTTVAARLTFQQLIWFVLPTTEWWASYLEDGRGAAAAKWFETDLEGFIEVLERALDAPSYQSWMEKESDKRKHDLTPLLVWLSHVAGTICMAEMEDEELRRKEGEPAWDKLGELRNSVNPEIQTIAETLAGLLEAANLRELHEQARVRRLQEMVKDTPNVLRSLVSLLVSIRGLQDGEKPTIRDVNRNRVTESSVYRSGKSTKSDAARHLFDVRGRGIRWAVIDSGIDARHLGFRVRMPNGRPLGKPVSDDAPGELDLTDHGRDEPEESFGKWAFCRVQRSFGMEWVNQTRVVATFDFTRIRDLLSATTEEEIPYDLFVRANENRRLRGRNRKPARHLASELRRALKHGSVIDWKVLDDFLRIPHTDVYEPPHHFHGTHVAGIMGADWRADEHELSPRSDRVGIAPEIELYDLRALDDQGLGDEFSILAAMQFVRYLNMRKTGKDQMEIHGANLSFSIKHEAASFACGRTPVCDEADRLVGAGVFVVAAAGNLGRARFQGVKGQTDEGYRSISITDPGNAQSVITVGATHSYEPHSYGVSYFSSRGPTGDGRPKPDLVAPGESIYSTIPGNAEGNTDGTSQAAPHVSGAAALLMERNPELIGQPGRLKSILCGSATDLGREKYFQGAGMLDILRAMQSV